MVETVISSECKVVCNVLWSITVVEYTYVSLLFEVCIHVPRGSNILCVMGFFIKDLYENFR